MRARLTAALILAAALQGCTADDKNVQLYALCTYNEECTFSSSCDAQLLGDLFVDLAVTNQLQMFVEVRNHASDDADEDLGQTNTNDARLESLEITYEGLTVSVPKTVIPIEEVVPAAGSAVVLLYGVAPPAAGASGGLAEAATILNMASMAAGGPIRVVAKLVVKGSYLGGDKFETAEWKVPIQICSGCITDLNAAYCPPGEVLESICPQVGQTAEPTCKEP